MTVPVAKDVRILWFHAYYDGPLSGLAEWRGEQLWFEVAGDFCELWDVEPRPFVLRRLAPEELAAAWASHDAFEAIDQRDAAAVQAFCERHPYVDHPYGHRPVVATFEE